MLEKHLKEILATGCFSRIIFQKAHALTTAAAGATPAPAPASTAASHVDAASAPAVGAIVKMRTTYVAACAADLERYLSVHQAEMKKDFVAHFPAGAVPSRQVWENVAAYTR